MISGVRLLRVAGLATILMVMGHIYMSHSPESIKESETGNEEDAESESIRDSEFESVKNIEPESVKEPQLEKVTDPKPQIEKVTEPPPDAVTTASINVTVPPRLDPAPGSSCHCTSCFTPKSYCTMPEVKWKRLQGVPWTSAFPQPPASAPRGCSLPHLDPWNPNILKLVSDKSWERVSCSGQKTLLYTSQDQLILNTTVLQELNLTREEVACSYRWSVYMNLLLPGTTRGQAHLSPWVMAGSWAGQAPSGM